MLTSQLGICILTPPGNIWTGFHTTFEGENRVFQKIEVPYYLNSTLSYKDTLTAQIYNEAEELIQTLYSQPSTKGLNYLIWKLDEKSAPLLSHGPEDEIRGIPVLPGTYKVLLTYGREQDSSYVEVIPDPRFELDPKVDEQLYQYQKAVDEQVVVLSASLKRIDQKHTALGQLMQQLSELEWVADSSLLEKIDQMKVRLLNLTAQGRTPRPDRQLGAWQTSEVSPYSKVQDVQMIAMSSIRPISKQEDQLLMEAKQMVGVFQKEVDQFFEQEWPSFVQQLKQAEINWLGKLE